MGLEFPAKAFPLSQLKLCIYEGIMYENKKKPTRMF